jgi:hypothetical protein
LGDDLSECRLRDLRDVAGHEASSLLAAIAENASGQR